MLVYMPLVTVAALPVMLPVMGFVTVKLVNVPTVVKLLVTTPDARVVPVSTFAAAVIVSVIVAHAVPVPSVVKNFPIFPVCVGSVVRYNSAKFAFIFCAPVRNVSPVPSLTVDPILRICCAIFNFLDRML